jgi:hypothetical protein
LAKSVPSELFERKLARIVGSSSDPIDRSRKIAESYLREMISPTVADPQTFDYRVCDAPNDGGLDAWGVDPEEKEVYLVQCKWYEDEAHILSQGESSELYDFVKDRLLPDNRADLNDDVKEFMARYKGYLTGYKLKLHYLTNCRFDDSVKGKYGSLGNQFSFKVVNKPELIGQWYKALEEEQPIDNYLVVSVRRGAYYESEFSVPPTEDIPQQKLRVVQCSLSASDLRRAYDVWQRKLLIRNLRYGLGGKINEGMKQTAESDLRHAFYVFHNGISIVCEALLSVKPEDDGVAPESLVQKFPELTKEEAEQISAEASSDRTKNFFVLRNFQIVNGAQSTETLADVTLGKLQDIAIPCKITQTSSPRLASMIAVYNNSQNAIKATDLVSNSAEQVFLQNYAAFEIDPPVFYIRKRKQKWTDIFRVHMPVPVPERRIDYPHAYQAFLAFMGNPIDAYSRPSAFINPDRTAYAQINEFPRKDLVILAGLLVSYEKSTRKDSDPEFTTYWSLWAVAVFGHLYRWHFDSTQQQLIEQALFSAQGPTTWRKISKELQDVFSDVFKKHFPNLRGREFHSFFKGDYELFDLRGVRVVKPKDVYNFLDPRARKSSLMEMRTAYEQIPYSLQYYDVAFAVFAKLFESKAPTSFDKTILSICK